MTVASKPAAPSAWAPFSHSAFALLWTATLISNIGTWMHDVGAGWLMTTLNPSPAVVSLVQAATTAPIFLFALLAGALADRVDKRKFLILINVALGIVVTGLAILTVFELVTPFILLVFTFLIGVGTAFMAPAWQAIVPALVPRDVLQPAIALNSMGINIARAIGPAIAGFLITAIGLGAPFVFNALSFVVIIAALVIWKPEDAPKKSLPPEPLINAIGIGVRHAMHNTALKATLLRAFSFFTFASAFWALLPLVARNLPGGGAELYGVMLALVGSGAVGAALVIPKIRQRFSVNALVVAGVVVSAFAMAVLGAAQSPAQALIAAGLGGVGWIMVLTGVTVSAQTALPNWVRARGMAIHLMVFFGCMAAGSAIWGQVATHTSISTALLTAAAGALVALPLVWRAKLGQGENVDLTPSLSWPAPTIAEAFDDRPDRGPVIITIRYEIDPNDAVAFQAAIHEFSSERYRDGAYNWGVYQDAADPRIWMEWFFLPSWAEHLRQHERVTHHDHDVQETVRAFHRGDTPPVVSHYLAP